MTGRSSARAALFAVLAFASSLASAATCYVNTAAPGGIGTSWANAYTDLQSALANYPTCTEVWIARGTYKPATTDRAISFNIKPGVFVYGGFAGTEVTLADRKVLVNPTILSGDIGVPGDSSDNSYHVVVMDATTVAGPIYGSTSLANVTISDGNANGAGANQNFGGGLFCNGSGAGHECSPELDNLIFENNSAASGGALVNNGSSSGKSSPTVKNGIFRNNTATGLGNGGAIYNNGIGGTSSPTVDQTTFTGNSAFSGGAMYDDGAAGVSSPLVRNSTFYANTAVLGGAMLNRGTSNGHASPVLRYVTFNHNTATGGPGGAIFNLASDGDAAPNLSGMIFWADQAASAPIEMQTVSLTTPSIEYSITPECPLGAVGCFNADPLLGPLRDNGGFAPTLKPDVGSPAIDAGNAVNCPAVDERGISRSPPPGAQCDLGAVELKLSERKICYVNYFALPPTDGASWGSAYSFLAQGLGDTTCNEVWVAKGTYKPPIESSDRAASFVVPPGKAVYGGFAVGATARSQRDPAANPTILSGDIGTVGDSSDNSYHVVVMDAVGAATNITNATVLDGFTITGGNANGAGSGQGFGGGLVCNGPVGFVCSPTLANLVFSANQAVNGGAIANLGANNGISSPTITSVTFSANHASTSGGAIWNACGGGICNAVVTGSRFEGNSAPIGGAVENDSANGSYIDVVFSANTSGNAGAVFNSDSAGPSSPSFRSVTFANNTATLYGGAVVNALGPASAPRFDAVVFTGNSAQSGGAVHNFGGNANFSDVLFLGNHSTVDGGAMDNYSDGNATPVTPVIDRAAFIGNTGGDRGGAIDIFGGSSSTAALLITNSTFSKNTAPDGGAINISAFGNYGASAVLRNVTFAGNGAYSGGAIHMEAQDGQLASVTASDALFWGDSASAAGPEMLVGNGVATIDHTLIQGGCPVGAQCSTILPTDPLLGLLQYNGGFTPTLMPAASSLALDNGANCTTADQRGVARPQGPACDLGAVERRAVEDYLFNNGFDW